MPRAPIFPAEALLAWYDRNARALPWRVAPADTQRGVLPDPYRVWLSEVMLQQTTVAAAAPRYQRFIERWPTVSALAAASLDDVLGEWAGLGYYARARNLHKAAIAVVERHDGDVPDTEEGLRALPGIGPYTAAAIAAIAFGRRAVVVDGNVERIFARWFATATPFPAGKRAVYERAASIWPNDRSGDFAQALMDIGAGACAPRAPDCADCPLVQGCEAFASGAPDAYPRRAPKTQRPVRNGAAFALFDVDGRVLVERRPDKGLLGGMIGLPGSPWVNSQTPDPFAFAPVNARWISAGSIDHVFTHFRLELAVYVADAAADADFANALALFWADPKKIRMPTVMRKALDAALGQERRRNTTEPAE